MNLSRHRVRCIKRKPEPTYDIKVIDAVDEEVQWGVAVRNSGSHNWLVTHHGTDVAMHLRARSVTELADKIAHMLDIERNGGAK